MTSSWDSLLARWQQLAQEARALLEQALLQGQPLPLSFEATARLLWLIDWQQPLSAAQARDLQELHPIWQVLGMLAPPAAPTGAAGRLLDNLRAWEEAYLRQQTRPTPADRRQACERAWRRCCRLLLQLPEADREKFRRQWLRQLRSLSGGHR
jgi:hypothetical protein